MERWTDEDWLAEVRAWVDEQVEVTGPLDQVHVRPWATVIRVPTPGGDVWFKANHEPLRHEAALVGVLAEVAPERVPPLVAADAARGWLLMRDAGERLRDVVARTRDLSIWLELLPLYAELQLAAAARADELVARGVPDLRLALLPGAFARTIERHPLLGDGVRTRALAIDIVGLCAELAAAGIPETVQHDDLHDGQVYVRDGELLILDWGDACVSHPFFTLAVTLGGVLSWGLDDVQGSVDVAPFRDAYLEPFTTFAPRPELVAAAETALRLGWACRFVNCSAGEPPQQNDQRLRMFLDGSP